MVMNMLWVILIVMLYIFAMMGMGMMINDEIRFKLIDGMDEKSGEEGEGDDILKDVANAATTTTGEDCV